MFFRAATELVERRPELLVGQFLALTDLKPVPGERPLVDEGLATVLTGHGSLILIGLRQPGRVRL